MPAPKDRKQVGFRFYPDQMQRLEWLRTQISKERGAPVSRNDVVAALVNEDYIRREGPTVLRLKKGK
jgi:hypothetical protein